MAVQICDDGFFRKPAVLQVGDVGELRPQHGGAGASDARSQADGDAAGPRPQVPKNTGNADAAWKFVEFLLEPENLKRHNLECAQIPPRASVANDPEFLEGAPYVKPLVPIFDKAEFLGRFNSDILKEYISQMYVSLVTDDGTYASVAEACQKLTDDLAANMKLY